jgi:DNA-binding NarL/FixJ family response regulator
MSVTVLLVDDDAGFRSAVKRLAQRERDLQLVGEAKDGEEAVQMEQKLKPEIVFMDIAMPKLDGLEATRRIKARRPEVKVIILSIHEEEAYRRAALECGADGFVLKKSILSDLDAMIRGNYPPH